MNTHLKRLPAAAHVQVVTVPHSIRSDETPTARPRGAFSFLRRRSIIGPDACEPDTLREQIEGHLAHARTMRPVPSSRPDPRDPVVVSDVTKPQTTLVPVQRTGDASSRSHDRSGSSAGRPAVKRVPLLGGSPVGDRRRAQRRIAGDLPGLWVIRLSSGGDGKIVDISSSGAFVETNTKITPGSTVDLQVLGQNTNVHVPARVVRSEVSSVDRLGVRYRAAAVVLEFAPLGEEVPA